MSGELYITRLCAWAPGIENPGEWEQWAQGRREILSGSQAQGTQVPGTQVPGTQVQGTQVPGTQVQGTQVPAISFTDPLFRRRLSQISKMTVQVVHGLLPVKEDTKMFFVSFRGELARQYQINKMLIEEKSLMPAAFSLSVFNAPAALASIALGLKGGYTALYPGNDSFAAGLAASQAFFSGTQNELIFAYADEQAPPEYGCFFQVQCPPAIAFALLLTREPQSVSIPLSALNEGKDSPLDFLRRLLLCGRIHVSS